MTKRAGWIIAGMFCFLLGLEVISESRRREAATYGQGGGGDVVCLCVTETPTFQMVISSTPSLTPTPTSGSSATPLPTLTVTPTRLPTLDPRTSLPPKDNCRFAEAAYLKGWSYRYLDSRNTGLRQNLRSGPGVNYPIVGTLAKNTARQVYFTMSGWFAVDSDCRIWLISTLGELVATITE